MDCPERHRLRKHCVATTRAYTIASAAWRGLAGQINSLGKHREACRRRSNAHSDADVARLALGQHEYRHHCGVGLYAFVSTVRAGGQRIGTGGIAIVNGS